MFETNRSEFKHVMTAAYESFEGKMPQDQQVNNQIIEEIEHPKTSDQKLAEYFMLDEDN